MTEKWRDPASGATYEWVQGSGWVRAYENLPQPGPIGTAMVQAGAELTDWGRAVGQLAGQDEAPTVAGERQLMGELSRRNPVSSLVGRMLPALATAPLGSGIGSGAMVPNLLALGRGIAPATLRGRLIEQGLIGAVQGGLLTPGGAADRATSALAGAAGAVGGEWAGTRLGAMAAARSASSRAAAAREAAQLQLEGELRGAGTFTAEQMSPEQMLGAARQAVADITPERLLTTPAPNKGLEGLRLEGRAEQLGFILTPADRLNSKTGKLWEASIESNPLTSALIEPIRETNREQLNRLALASIGEPGPIGRSFPEISPSDLGAANTRISREFEQVENQLGDELVMDSALRLDLVGIGTRASRGWPRRAEVRDQVAEGIREFSKPFRGRDLMETRRRLTQDMTKARLDGDAYKVGAYREMVDSIDRYIIRTTDGTPIAANYKRARDQWRALQTLESPGVVNGKGEVVGRSLYNQLRLDYPAEFMRGDMYNSATPEMLNLFDGARILEHFGDVVGNSGTATRQTINELMKSPTIGGALALGANWTAGKAMRAIYKDPARQAAMQAYREALQKTMSGAAGAAVGRAAAEQLAPQQP